MQVFKGLKLKTVLPIVLFAAVMTWLLLFVLAAGPFVSIETESASTTGNVEVKTDSNASAGSYLSFGTTSTGGGGNDPWSDAGVKSFPCSGVTINPGDSWQNKVDANPVGTTFCIKKGVHRLQKVNSKANNTFIGEVGAILNGSKVLSGWTKNGNDWVVGGQTQAIDADGGVGRCTSKGPRCNFAEQLFINNKRLNHVASRAGLKAGSWYFDYAADKIYMRDNPTGQTVETSVQPYAIGGSNADNVTIKGLIVEKYAVVLQTGALYNLTGSTGWLIQNNELRYNNGAAIRSSSDWKIVGNFMHHNSQYAISGSGNDSVVEGNEIAFNNPEYEVNPSWGGSATKWNSTRNLVVRGNYSHDNGGPGFWTDGENIYVLYEDNLIVNNRHAGIKHEVSCDATIRNNEIRGNGFSVSGWVDGAGILVANSPNVEVYGNTVVDNFDGIAGIHATRKDHVSPCDRVLKNFWVHDNYIEMTEGQTGVAANFEHDVVTSKAYNNRFDNNTYKLNNNDPHYRWTNTITTAQWKAAGQDKNSIWK